MAIFPTAGLLDDFNGSDTGPPPGPNWAAWKNTGLRRASNQLAPNDADQNDAILTANFGVNMEAALDIVTLPPSAGNFFMWIRLEPVAVDGYAVNIFPGPPVYIGITRFDDWAGTEIANAQNTGFANGDAIGIGAEGSLIAAFARLSGVWRKVCYATDATYSGPPYNQIGIHNNQGSVGDTTSRFDNLYGGTMLDSGYVRMPTRVR